MITKSDIAMQRNAHSLLNAWRSYLAMTALSGLFIVGFALLAPGAPRFSTSHLVIVGSIASVSAFLLLLLMETWLRQERANKRLSNIIAKFQPARRWKLALLINVIVCLSALFIVTLTFEIDEPYTQTILSRIAPFTVWISIVSAITVAWILYLEKETMQPFLRPGWVILITLAYLGLTIITWITYAKPLLPETITRTGWNVLGAPLVYWQVILAGLVAFFIWRLLRLASGSKAFAWVNARKLDIILSLLVWLVTVFSWQSMPIQMNWFVADPAYPGFERYPTSDARNYDAVAQDLMTGAGYRFAQYPFVRRPVHAIYLFTLHQISGQDYETLVFFQVLVLAWFPVMIFLLARLLSNRLAGLIAALLIMIREANSIALAGKITTSHAKLLMVDLVTAFILVIFIYLLTRWLSQSRQASVMALACGSFLGLVMLVRLETFIFIFPLLIIMALQWQPERLTRIWLQQAFMFLVGIVVFISPWVWRNWETTGLLFIDSPGHRQTLIEQRFGPSSTPTTPPDDGSATIQQSSLPKRTDFYLQAAKSIRFPVASIALASLPQSSNVSQGAPGAVPLFITHYVNSQIQTILILPTTFRGFDSLITFTAHRTPSRLWEDCCSLTDYIRRMPYWRRWSGDIPLQAFVPLAVNMIILALGVHIGWKNKRWIGVLPGIFAIIYIAGNAFFRNSGGRYLLPVDWTSILYFSMGMASLIVGVLTWLTGEETEEDVFIRTVRTSDDYRAGKFPRSKFFSLVFSLSLFIALALPALEILLPDRYPAERQEAMQTEFLASNLLSDTQRRQLQAYLENGAQAYAGRILFPQYYPANDEDVLDERTGPFPNKPYDRLIFFLSGKNSKNYILPIEESFPKFPNDSSAIVITCPEIEKYGEQILALGIFDSAGIAQIAILRSPFPEGNSCPLPME